MMNHFRPSVGRFGDAKRDVAQSVDNKIWTVITVAEFAESRLVYELSQLHHVSLLVFVQVSTSVVVFLLHCGSTL